VKGKIIIQEQQLPKVEQNRKIRRNVLAKTGQ